MSGHVGVWLRSLVPEPPLQHLDSLHQVDEFRHDGIGEPPRSSDRSLHRLLDAPADPGDSVTTRSKQHLSDLVSRRTVWAFILGGLTAVAVIRGRSHSGGSFWSSRRGGCNPGVGGSVVAGIVRAGSDNPAPGTEATA